MRESNPRPKLGRLLCYLYTNAAYGARRGNRTPNLRITSALRYQLRHAGIIDAGDQPYQGQDPSWHLQLTTFRVQKNVAKQSDSFVSSSTPEFSVTRYLEPHLIVILSQEQLRILYCVSEVHFGEDYLLVSSHPVLRGGERHLAPQFVCPFAAYFGFNYHLRLGNCGWWSWRESNPRHLALPDNAYKFLQTSSSTKSFRKLMPFT